MVAHDENIGRMLNKLDELGIAEDTIVMYSTDNGPHYNSWPDAGITPFRVREEHQLGRRLARAGVRSLAREVQGRNGAQRHRHPSGLDGRRSWPPQESPISRRSSSKGTQVGAKTYKVHIDGFNMLPYLTGEVKESPRRDSSSTSAMTATSWRSG